MIKTTQCVCVCVCAHFHMQFLYNNVLMNIDYYLFKASKTAFRASGMILNENVSSKFKYILSFTFYQFQRRAEVMLVHHPRPGYLDFLFIYLFMFRAGTCQIFLASSVDLHVIDQREHADRTLLIQTLNIFSYIFVKGLLFLYII